MKMSLTTLSAEDVTNNSDVAMVTASGVKESVMDVAQMMRAKEIAQLGLYIGIGLNIPILVFGLVGNSLSFYILRRKLKMSSTHTYLSALAVVDSLFLFVSIGKYKIIYSIYITVFNIMLKLCSRIDIGL